MWTVRSTTLQLRSFRRSSLHRILSRCCHEPDQNVREPRPGKSARHSAYGEAPQRKLKAHRVRLKIRIGNALQSPRMKEGGDEHDQERHDAEQTHLAENLDEGVVNNKLILAAAMGFPWHV